MAEPAPVWIVNARLAAEGIPDERLRLTACYTVASVELERGLPARALKTLGIRNLDDCMLVLATWVPLLEAIERGLALRILREVIHIIGWVRPDWLEIEVALRPAD